MNLSLDLWILLLRLLLVLVIYTFLYQVAAAIYRSLRTASAAPPEREPAATAKARRTTTPSARPVASLLVIASDLPDVPVGTTFDVAGPTTIGRAARNDIQINDTFISAEHARIEPYDGALRLTDLGSTNGTLVNGEPVTSTIRIAGGDTIQLGSVRLAVRQVE